MSEPIHLTKQQCAAVYSGKQCQLDAQHTGRHLRHLDSGQRLEWWEGEALTSKLCNCLDNECHAVPGWTCRKKIMGPDHADEQGVEVVCEAGSSLTPSGAPVRAKAVEPDRSRLLTSKNESRLLAALQRYGTHADYCAMYKGPIEDGCNCGLFEAMGLAPDGKPLSGDGSQVETKAPLTLGKLILQTAQGDVKERVLTAAEVADIHAQLGPMWEKAKGRFRFLPDETLEQSKPSVVETSGVFCPKCGNEGPPCACPLPSMETAEPYIPPGLRYWRDQEGRLHCKHGVILYGSKCLSCEKDAPKASEQECRSAGPSGNAAGTGPVDPGAEARSSRREVTAQNASVNPYCLQDGVPCASDGRGGCLACVDEKGTLNGRADGV